MSENVEMYLKTIWLLTQDKGYAKTTEISSKLKLVPSTVTEMLQRLAEEGYVIHENYKGCRLTKNGNKLASEIIRKERLLKRFLHTVLKLPKDLAREQACRLEHYINKDTESALCKYMGCPDKCPVDNLQIGKCKGCI